MKNKLIWLLVIVLIVGVVYYYDNQEKEVDIVIKIGSLSNASGFGAIWGVGEQKGFQMRIDELKEEGLNFKVVYEDCASDIPGCITAARKLIDSDKVDVIVGPTWTEWYEAVHPVVNKAGVTLIAPSGGDTGSDPQPYGFSLGYNQDALAERMLQFVQEQGKTKAAIVNLRLAYYDLISDELKRLAPKYGIEIVSDQKLTDPEDTNFGTVITKMKNDGAEIVFGNHLEVGELTRQVVEFGLDWPVVFSSTWTDTPVDQGYFSDYAVDKEWLARYVKKFGEDPSPSSKAAYDAVSMIADAVRDGATNSDEIANWLRAQKDYEAVTGKVTFDERGFVQWPPDVYDIVPSSQINK